MCFVKFVWNAVHCEFVWIRKTWNGHGHFSLQFVWTLLIDVYVEWVCWDVCDMVYMWCLPFVLTKFKCMWAWCFMMDGVRSMLMCIFPNFRVVSMLMIIWSLIRMLQKHARQDQVGPSIGDFCLISFYYFLCIIIFLQSMDQCK